MSELKREQFLPAITTTYGSDWRAKVAEIDVLGLKKVALFPTALQKAERAELFDLLAKTHLETIPFAHIRTDMEPSELDWLIQRYHTQVFNLHSPREHAHLFDYTDYKKMIYLENVYSLSFEETEVQKWAGICLDLSHLENFRRSESDKFHWLKGLLTKYPIGCNHISAVSDEPYVDECGWKVYARHHFQNLNEFDYLSHYPREYFSNFVALELENSLADQLKVLDYILKIKNAG